MLWSAALFFYVYYTPALPDCQRLLPLPKPPKTPNLPKTPKTPILYTPSGPEGV